MLSFFGCNRLTINPINKNATAIRYFGLDIFVSLSFPIKKIKKIISTSIGKIEARLFKLIEELIIFNGIKYNCINNFINK